MPINKWIVQYLIALPILFALLAGVQYLKGRTAEYALEFGVLWAFVTVVTFAIARYYNYRKNIDCDVCNDLPNDTQDSGAG